MADVNGDGQTDLITSKDFSTDYPEPTIPEFEIYIGQKDGTFRKTAVYAPFDGVAFLPGGTWRYGPRVGDFNGDGAVDIAAFQHRADDYSRSFVQFLLGVGDGAFVQSQWSYDFNELNTPEYVSDLDGDGFSDLVEIRNGSVGVIRGEQGPSFEFELLNPSVEGTRGYARIRLSKPYSAPVEILLTTDERGIQVPPRLTIATGQIEASFAYTIGSRHDWKRGFTISAFSGSELRSVSGRQKPPVVVYVPHVGDGNDGQLGLKTSLMLVNTGDDARAELEFFDRTYQAMPIDFEGIGPKATMELELPRGHARSLESSGLGILRTGYCRVTVFGTVGGTTVFSGIDVPSGKTLFEAGVPLVEPQFEATLLVDTFQKSDTGLAIVNTATGDPQTTLFRGDSSPVVHLYNEQYVLQSTESPTLGPGEYLAQFLPEMFLGAPQVSEMRGAVTLESSRPLALTTLRMLYDSHKPFPLSVPSLTTFPVISSSPEHITNTNQLIPTHYYLAQFANGNQGNLGVRTSLTLVNTGLDSGANIDFFDTGGNPMEVTLGSLGKRSRFSLALKRGESRTLVSSGTGNLQVGHVRVQALEKVAGTAVYTGVDLPTGTVLYEAGLPLMKPLKRFSLFVDSLGNRNTGIAFANGQDTSATPELETHLRLRLYDTQFVLLGEKSLTLPLYSQQSRFVHELFPIFPRHLKCKGF